jgi:hypothetical protein
LADKVNAKRRKLFYIAAISVVAIIIACSAPCLYKSYTVFRFAKELNQEFGRDGWVVVWMEADRQSGEQIHLYRTIYVRFLYPKFQNLTPWKNLKFSYSYWDIRPSHCVICVATKKREITYRWSMKNNEWVMLWDNRIDQEPEGVQQTFAKLLKQIVQVNGLNQPVNPLTPNDSL